MVAMLWDDRHFILLFIVQYEQQLHWAIDVYILSPWLLRSTHSQNKISRLVRQFSKVAEVLATACFALKSDNFKANFIYSCINHEG